MGAVENYPYFRKKVFYAGLQINVQPISREHVCHQR